MNLSIKPTYLIIGAAIALSACSHDDMPGRTDAGDNRILFRASLPGLASRADLVTEENLQHFYVTAFDNDETSMEDGKLKPLFGNEIIAVSGSDATYTSPYCCWPDVKKESHLISFFGFYPGLDKLDGAALSNTSLPGAVNYKLTGFRVADDIADQVDFITAYTSGTMATNLFSGVKLPFAHQLSRIEIRAYGAHESCDIEIAGVRIGGVGVEDTFSFGPVDGGGQWSGAPVRDSVSYVFRSGDKIVTCGKNHPIKKLEDAVSIMGSPRFDGKNQYENCAMLIPGKYAEWDFVGGDRRNSKNRMFISVLLRVTDATPTAGEKPADKQRFPYTDLSQGADAMKVPVVYLAVKKESGEVSTRLYKKNGNYYTDSECKTGYDHPSNEEIKAFGWAALPVDGDWAPGFIYTYLLDYTYGVGRLEPTVTTGSPGAGDPVISDRVGVDYTVKEWQPGGGSQFVVPGS